MDIIYQGIQFGLGFCISIGIIILIFVILVTGIREYYQANRRKK